MHRWNAWLLILAIVIIITTGGFFTQWYLDRSANELADRLGQVQQQLETGDWEGSAHSLATLSEDWSNSSDTWVLFTDHAELDALELSLVRLQSFIATRNEAEARAAAGEAMDLIRQIPDQYRLTWRNIF